MARDPEVLLVGQPTRGVDIGAIEFIHRQLVAMRDAGCAILLVSVELDEILALADRILVMCGGRIVGEVARRRRRRARARPDDGECAETAGADRAANRADSSKRRVRCRAGPISASSRSSTCCWPSSSAGLIVLIDRRESAGGAAHHDRRRARRSEGIGYTLYYTTNFIFTGLAVAVAFHAGLFNIGGEGQAYIGGLGVGLAMLAFDRLLPLAALMPLAILAAALFGAAGPLIPAWLQA